MADDEQEWLDLLGPPPPPKPYAHQQREFDEHRDTPHRALLWSMRTGKSRAVIDKASYQFAKGAIEGVVVLGPNGVHTSFGLNEVPRWSWHPHPEVYIWDTPRRGEPERVLRFNEFLKARGPKWMCVNREALLHPDARRAVQAFLRACHFNFMVAISEAHHFGSPAAAQTRFARTLTKLAKFVTIETGTAILNSPLKAYAIYKVMDDKSLGPEYEGDTYAEFCTRYATYEEGQAKSRLNFFKRKYKKIAGYQNLDELRDKIAVHSSVVLRRDIPDMPSLIETERTVVMSDKQRRAYIEMVSEHLVEIGDGSTVNAAEASARVLKLQQILNGYVKDGDTIRDIDPKAPIYDALVEEVRGTLPGKTLVWCRFREDIRRCVKALQDAGFGVLEFHGGVPNAQREGIRLAFQRDPAYTVLVGQPAAGGEGRDFSAADTIVFFSSTPNAIHYEQARERGTKVGGKSVSIVRLRTRGTVDDRNWELIESKVALADTITGEGLRELLLRTDV